MNANINITASLLLHSKKINKTKKTKKTLEIDAEMKQYEISETYQYNKDNLSEIYDNLEKLYNNVIKVYRDRQLDIYNPHIFSEITLKLFIEWIIKNNLELKIEIENLNNYLQKNKQM